MSNEHDDNHLRLMRSKYYSIRDFNLYQYQKEAAKWQRQKEKLRPRQR